MSQDQVGDLNEESPRPPAPASAYWDARLRSPDCTAEERRAFQKWLFADPAHADEFEKLQQALSLLQAASAAHPLLRAIRDSSMQTRRNARLRHAAVAIAATVVASVASWMFLSHWRGDIVVEQPAISLLQTSVGERSSVVLGDGSEVALDSRTRVEIRYTPQLRSITVLEGGAYFKVAKNHDRPFVVDAGGQQVVAVGTEFDVRLDERSTRVTLVEGRVDVGTSGDDLTTGRRVYSMNAGEQLSVDLKSGATIVEPADVARVTSWRDGKIIFEDTPLAEAIADMNRYSSTHLVIADPAIAGLRINGMFYTSRPASFVVALRSYFSIRTRVFPDGTIELFAANNQED